MTEQWSKQNAAVWAAVEAETIRRERECFAAATAVAAAAAGWYMIDHSYLGGPNDVYRVFDNLDEVYEVIARHYKPGGVLPAYVWCVNRELATASPECAFGADDLPEGVWDCVCETEIDWLQAILNEWAEKNNLWIYEVDHTSYVLLDPKILVKIARRHEESR